MRYIRWIWTNMAGIRWNTAIRIITGITQVLLGLLMIWLSKQFIDITIRVGTRDDVLRMCTLLISVVVTGILLRQFYYSLSVKASTHQSNTIRLRVFSNLFRRQMYEDQLHSGDVASRLSKDIDTVADATTSLLPQFIVTGTQLVGAFLLLAKMDLTLALALLLVTPFLAAFGKFFAHRMRAMTTDIRQQESAIQMQVQEGMEYSDVIRSLGSEQWVADRLNKLQELLMGRVLRRSRFTIITRLLMAFAFSLGYLLAFIWGGLQLRAGVITFGVMTSFLQLVGQIQHPILNLLNMLPQFISATASIDRIDELERSAKQRKQAEKQVMLQGPVGVQASEVTFGYASGDRLILDHFSHLFRPGSKTAILGQTGIGKTTLFRLMLSFIQPREGSLTLFNREISEAVSDHTRGNFVFVPQGNTLMSGTIRYNLQLARPTATDKELCDVLDVAMADFVFSLPNGLDTKLGERGAGLSEGQAQRIGIARGLLRPGPIMLLDEISSSLDEATEQELFRRLFVYCHEKTMIFITHRMAVCELCDDVLRLGED